MQISSLSTAYTVTSGTVTTQRQQVELQQDIGGNVDGSGSGKNVLPDFVHAVSPVGQALLQESVRDAAKKRQEVDQKELLSSVDQLNEMAAKYDSKLEFSVDKDTNIEVVRVVDKESDKVIRQIPSADAIRIAKAIGDFKGLLIKDMA